MIDRKEYLNNYHKTKLKRVPLDMPIDKYNELKKHCDKINEPVNTFIKRAIQEQIKRDNEN